MLVRVGVFPFEGRDMDVGVMLAGMAMQVLVLEWGMEMGMAMPFGDMDIDAEPK